MVLTKITHPNTAICCQGIGKYYNSPSQKQKKLSIQQSLQKLIQHPFSSLKQVQHWSLHPCSFQVSYGEILGIVGPNGAGKSTLLKILAKITQPSVGKAWLSSHVFCLLEAGAAFHPDLSGEENIYLLGSMMAMKRRQIQQHLQTITEFSELADHLPMAVKHYSSGMLIRLAFAIACHLPHGILLLDEIFSVTDRDFSLRCQEKLKELSKEGRCILLASHDLSLLRKLSHRCLWLQQGKQMSIDSTESILSHYEADASPPHLVSYLP